MTSQSSSHRRRRLRDVFAQLLFASIAVAIFLSLPVIYVAQQSVAAAAESEPGAVESESAASATPSPPPPIDGDSESEACRLARTALNDGDAKRAVELLEAINVTDDNVADLESPRCEATWALASGLTAEDPPTQTASETFGKAWDGFVKTVGAPLAGAAAFIIGGWLALFVLARLLVELPAFRALESDQTSHRRIGVLGLVILAIAPIVGVCFGSVSAGLGLGFVLATWFLIGCLGAIGVIALASWLATIRALKIELTPATDAGKLLDRSMVAAQLRAFAQASGKIELPNGPYLTGLTDSLKEFSSSVWVGAVQKIVLFLVGVTPWTASIVVYSETEASLTITRNRTTRLIATVSTRDTGLEALASPPSDTTASKVRFLSTLLAAHILMELRSCYREDMDPGLDHATEARGVALQYIATTWYAKGVDTANAQALLRTALRADPFNELARYSLAYVTDRHCTEATGLESFGNQLDTWIDARFLPSGQSNNELLRAMVVTRGAAARNLAAISLSLARTAAQARERANCAIWPFRRGAQEEAAKAAAAATQARAAALSALAAATSRTAHLAKYDSELDGAKDRVAAIGINLAQAALTLAAWRLASADEADGPQFTTISAALKDDLATLAATATSATTDPELETVAARRQAVVFLEDAIRDSTWTASGILAYSLVTALLAWGRASFEDPLIKKLLEIAFKVQLFKEFAPLDPELISNRGFSKWKDSLPPTAAPTVPDAAAKTKPAGPAAAPNG